MWEEDKGEVDCSPVIKSLQGCVKEFEPYLVVFQVWEAIKDVNLISSFACLFLTELKRRKKSVLIPSHFQINFEISFYLFHIPFQAPPPSA